MQTKNTKPFNRMTQNPSALPPMDIFNDVLAGPAENRRTPGVCWPDFHNQRKARIWRNGIPFCQPPNLTPVNPTVIEEPGVFVSAYDDHFGHICAETVPRIPQSLADAPDLPLYFGSAQPMTYARSSIVFRSILEWLHVPHDKIRFIYKPTLFRELRIAAQAETLNGDAPTTAYLDLLEARIAKNFATPRHATPRHATPRHATPERDCFCNACASGSGFGDGSG